MRWRVIVVWIVMFLKIYIPRNGNLVGGRIVGLKGFLTKDISYEYKGISSIMELESSFLVGGDNA